ncbi:ankyrin repeat domain-containing protein 12 isoform X2 [Strongylocentrotus purpuratus]|uniref:Ankyrin repeat domain-containing protein 12 n=1 Tax=Strongylocentrotus purpuratus TaxID=7668 RepID=A0A7M7N721_STRPU|nr:ankyrin repeat domain-containing protein 12 isoform X2 [Strongylocentrotus purpuratus]
MAEKASPHKKEKQPPLKMPQSAKAESKTSLKRRLFNTSINGEEDKKASKPAPKRKKPGSQPGSPTLLGTPGRTIPLSERQQLALLMQMTANEENSNPVPVQTPQSKNSHNPTTPNSSGGVKNKVNKRNERGETALHMAAIKGDSQMALNLINQGAEVNVQDFAGWTPLHEACNHGYYEVAKVLIKAGASVNTMGLEDDTPLHDAAVNGHVKVVKLLLKHGANPLQVNKRGKAPLDIACSTEIHSLMSLEIIASSSDGSDHVVRSPSSPESMASPHPINAVHNNLNSSSKVVKNGTELPEDPYEFTQDSGSSEQKITIHWASPDKSGKGANVMEITRTIPKVRDIAAPNSVSSTTTSESDLFDPHLTSTSSKLECVEEERRLPSPSISTSVTPMERTRDSLPVTRVTLTEVKEDSDSCISETNLYISDDSNMAGETHKEVSSKADSTTVNDGILSWNLKSKLNDNGLSGKVVSSLRSESARVSCSAPSPLTDRQSGSDSRAAVSPYDFNANENEVRTMETTLTRPDPVSNRNRFSPTRSSPSLQSAHTASSKHSETPRDVCDSLSVQQESVSSNCVQTSGIHSPGKQSSGHESERSEPDSDQRTESRRESPSQSIPESRERSESDSSHETKHHGREKSKKHKDRSHKSHKKEQRHHRHHSHSSRKEEKMDTTEEATTSTQSALVQVKEDSKTHEKVSSPQVGEETQEQLSRKSPDRKSPFPAVAREYYIVSPPSSGDNAGEIKSLLLRISSDASHKSKDNTSSSTSSVSSTSASGSNMGNHKNDTKPLGNVNERTSGSNGENGNAQKSPVSKEAERRRSPARGSPDVTSSINGTVRSGSPKGIEKAADKTDKTEKCSESSTTSSTCSNDEKQPAKVTRTLRSNSALTSNSDSNGNEEKKDDKDKATFSQPMTRSRRNQVEAAAAAATAPPNANASNNEETHMDSHPRKRKMARHRQNQQMEEALHVSSAPQEKVNSIEAFLNIRHQVAERQKTLMASVQPKPPNGYKEYLMFRKNYLLQSDPDNKIVQVIPRMTAPVNLTNGLLAQFSEQEKIRHELRLRHYIEREKLMLAAEQDIVRVHGRAARALVNQTIPFSVCTVLKDMEIYNMPEPLPLEDKSSIRQRFNGRQFISWLQDVDEKYEKLKEELLQRHQHEAASLYAIQKLEWELKLQELKQWDFKSPPPVHSSHVPIVEVNRDFDLLPA